MMRAFARAAVGLAACACVAGCVSRRVSITSDPPGALVAVNDVEVGRTPVEAELTYYGMYDVRVEKPGYETLRTRAPADAPFYEYPPVDLAAMTWPAGAEHVVRWHFRLEPALEKVQGSDEFDQGLINRAHDLRGKIEK